MTEFSIILWVNYSFNQTTKTEYAHERSGSVLALSTRLRNGARGRILFQGVLAPEDSSMKGYPGGLSSTPPSLPQQNVSFNSLAQFPSPLPKSSCEPQIA